MSFEQSDFNKPSYSESEEVPKKLILISTEGRNTEPEYFNAIKTKLGHQIDAVLQVEVYPKNDNASAPKHVLQNLKRFIDIYDFNSAALSSNKCNL